MGRTILDRKKLKQDRVRPVFIAYGLVEGLTDLIKMTADSTAKKALSNLLQDLDEKGCLQWTTWGIRSSILKKISDNTRNLITENNVHLATRSEVVRNLLEDKKLKRIKGLLEVNLKEFALEDFLSSLRIWSAK